MLCYNRVSCLIGLRNNIWASGKTESFRNFKAGEDTSECTLMNPGWKWVSTSCDTPLCFICERGEEDPSGMSGVGGNSIIFIVLNLNTCVFQPTFSPF